MDMNTADTLNQRITSFSGAFPKEILLCLQSLGRTEFTWEGKINTDGPL